MQFGQMPIKDKTSKASVTSAMTINSGLMYGFLLVSTSC